MLLPTIFVALLLLSCGGNTNSGTNSPSPPTSENSLADKSIKLPEGFTALVVADSIGRWARHIAVRENGDVYVQMRVLKDNHGITALRDTNGDEKADIIKRFGSNAGTGMAIHNGYLYCSSDVAVFRYPLKKGQLVPNENERELVAGGFPEQNQHAAKSFTFDGNNYMYVNVGGPSNACMEQTRTLGSKGMDPCPQLKFHAGIWRFDANKANQLQSKDGHRYASGLRNCVAIDWNFKTNSLFVVQHGRDQLKQFWPALYSNQESAELPSEEFFELKDGDFCGWPYCYFNRMENKKILNPEYGGDAKKQGRCSDAKVPLMGFPGHLAPNDLLFYTGDQFPQKYKNGAFIAFHGSWNRAPLEQKGYFVVFIPFKGGRPFSDWEVFAKGFAGSESIKSPTDAKHRPMGLAQGSDGSLYVTDSVKGKIWKIVYRG